jgi:hypothetical protein
VRTALHTMAGRLVARTCERDRNHDGLCRDKYGNWHAEA